MSTIVRSPARPGTSWIAVQVDNRSGTRTVSFMCDVFLFRDLGVFELAVRGDVKGTEAEVITLVVRHLPIGSEIVIDLSEIDELDEIAAAAIVESIARRRPDLVAAAFVVSHPSVGALLQDAGVDDVSCGLAGSAMSAREALARRHDVAVMRLSA